MKRIYFSKIKSLLLIILIVPFFMLSFPKRSSANPLPLVAAVVAPQAVVALSLLTLAGYGCYQLSNPATKQLISSKFSSLASNQSNFKLTEKDGIKLLCWSAEGYLAFKNILSGLKDTSTIYFSDGSFMCSTESTMTGKIDRQNTGILLPYVSNSVTYTYVTIKSGSLIESGYLSCSNDHTYISITPDTYRNFSLTVGTFDGSWGGGANMSSNLPFTATITFDSLSLKTADVLDKDKVSSLLNGETYSGTTLGDVYGMPVQEDPNEDPNEPKKKIIPLALPGDYLPDISKDTPSEIPDDYKNPNPTPDAVPEPADPNTTTTTDPTTGIITTVKTDPVTKVVTTTTTDPSTGTTTTTVFDPNTTPTPTPTPTPTDYDVPSDDVPTLNFRPLMVATQKFPFCIPWDLWDTYKIFEGNSEPFKYEFKEVRVNFSYMGDGSVTVLPNFTLDFADYPQIDTAIQVFKFLQLMGFMVFLILKTRTLIRG